jgi:tRNA-5-taurinomethyluridine 2-sulfurtransferase
MNAIYVSLDYFSDDKSRNAFVCSDFNWISGSAPVDVGAVGGWGGPDGSASSQTLGEQREASPLFVKVRHGPTMYECKAFHMDPCSASAYVELAEDDQGLAPGQYAVFYQDNVCLGCAVIQSDPSHP